MVTKLNNTIIQPLAHITLYPHFNSLFSLWRCLSARAIHYNLLRHSIIHHFRQLSNGAKGFPLLSLTQYIPPSAPSDSTSNCINSVFFCITCNQKPATSNCINAVFLCITSNRKLVTSNCINSVFLLSQYHQL